MNRRDLLLGGLAAVGCSSGLRLNIFNWSDYVAPSAIPEFEAEFGLRVRYGTYESNEEMLARVMSGNSGWDIVFPSEDMIGPMRDLGLLAEINHDWLPNLNNLEQEFQRPPWDQELRWCVPYMYGVTGIVYQKKLAQPPSAWEDLWRPDLRGRITMLDDQNEVFAACLKKVGFSVNSSNPNQLTAAQKQAISQKPLLRAYMNADVRDQLVSGDVLVAQAWAVTAGQAIAAAPDRLAFTLPREGFPRFADNVAILRETPRIRAAHQWIDYLLRPQVAANTVAAIHTATANGAALKLLPLELRANSVLYPPTSDLARGEWFTTPSVTVQRLRDRLWTEIKSA